MVPQYPAQWQHGQKSFDDTQEIEIRCVQNEIARIIVGCQFGRETTAHAPAIHDQVIFLVLFLQPVVHELHIIEHILLTAFSGTLAEATVIHQYHIIIISVKIARISRPSFDAAGVAMEIKDEAFRVVAKKMQPIDPYARLNIEEIFPERDIIFECEILLQLLRFEYQLLLQQICQDGEEGDGAEDIPE